MTELSPIRTESLSIYVSPGSELARLIGGWLIARRSDLTRDAYREDLDRWLAFLAQVDVHPLDVTTDHVEAYMRVCEREHVGPTERVWRPATVARRVAAVSSFYM